MFLCFISGNYLRGRVCREGVLCPHHIIRPKLQKVYHSFWPVLCRAGGTFRAGGTIRAGGTFRLRNYATPFRLQLFSAYVYTPTPWEMGSTIDLSHTAFFEMGSRPFFKVSFWRCSECLTWEPQTVLLLPLLPWSASYRTWTR